MFLRNESKMALTTRSKTVMENGDGEKIADTERN